MTTPYYSDESVAWRASNRAARIPVMFAAKFWNDAAGREPTDENLAVIFAGCCRPPGSEWYPAIREQIAELAQDVLDFTGGAA